MHSQVDRRRYRMSIHIANDGPARIQYKRLVPIYVLPEMKLCGLVIPKHSCICKRFYKFSGSVCQFCKSQIGRPILGIYKSLTGYMNVGIGKEGRAVSFLGIHKSGYRYSVIYVYSGIVSLL
jgi:hypothetical protein